MFYAPASDGVANGGNSVSQFTFLQLTSQYFAMGCSLEMFISASGFVTYTKSEQCLCLPRERGA